MSIALGSHLRTSKTNFFLTSPEFSVFLFPPNSSIASLLNLSKLNVFSYYLSNGSKFLNWPISTNFYTNAGWIPFLNKPTKAISLYPESSFQVTNSDQKSSSNLFPCFNLVNLSIAWVWVSVDMKNYTISSAIFSQESKGGLLVMVDILSSPLVLFYSFWKGKNFLIWVSVHCWAQLSFSPLIFPKAILILSHFFEILLLWKNSVILRHQALTSSGFLSKSLGSFVLLLAGLSAKSFLTSFMKVWTFVA